MQVTLLLNDVRVFSSFNCQTYCWHMAETCDFFLGNGLACGFWMDDVMFSLQTERAIYLKIPFQLNCKLHNILHVESDFCNCSKYIL